MVTLAFFNCCRTIINVRSSLTADLQSSKYVRFVLWVQRLLQESKYANQLGSGYVGNRSCRQVAPAASIVNISTAALCFFFTTFFTNSARAEVLKVIALATFFAGTVRLFLVTVLTSSTSTCTHHVCTLITNFIHSFSQPLNKQSQHNTWLFYHCYIVN